MSTPQRPDTNLTVGPTPAPGRAGGMAHGGHSWMMIACCVPMLVIAVVLVASGVAGVGFLFGAVMCTLMMAMMMGGMGHGNQGRR